MRTTHRTGAWWFMQELCRRHHYERPDSDGEFFFFPGKLISYASMLKPLRDAYACVKLMQRMERYLAEIGRLNPTYFLCAGQPPLEWYFCKRSIVQRRGLLRQNVRTLKRRLEVLRVRNIFIRNTLRLNEQSKIGV